MTIINLAATQVTSAIDMKSTAGLKKKEQYQAKMDDPVHMELISENVDDFPELAIILLQIEKLSDDLNNLRIFAESIKHMKKYEPQMVAGTLMAIAIRLYKTNLSDDGFSEMLQTILDSEGDIKSYVDEEDTLH